MWGSTGWISFYPVGSSDALCPSSQPPHRRNLLFDQRQRVTQPRGQSGFFSSKEERNFTFWLVLWFSQELIVDSGNPPLEKGVGNHSLVAEKNFKVGKVSNTVALGLGETNLEWEFWSRKIHFRLFKLPGQPLYCNSSSGWAAFGTYNYFSAQKNSHLLLWWVFRAGSGVGNTQTCLFTHS